MTITEHPMPNGVDTATLFATIDMVKETPEIAKFQFRATNRWVSGTHSQSTMYGFHGAMQDLMHDQPFTVTADHPAVLVGGDRGPTPVEYVLHALAACLTAGIANVAAARGVHLTEVESTVEGDIDVLGILGLSDEVRNGYQGITVRDSGCVATIQRSCARSWSSPAVVRPSSTSSPTACRSTSPWTQAEAPTPRDPRRARHDHTTSGVRRDRRGCPRGRRRHSDAGGACRAAGARGRPRTVRRGHPLDPRIDAWRRAAAAALGAASRDHRGRHSPRAPRHLPLRDNAAALSTSSPTTGSARCTRHVERCSTPSSSTPRAPPVPTCEYGIAVRRLRRDDCGRVVGVEGIDRLGRTFVADAGSVVGADGLRSVVAERDGVHESCAGPAWAAPSCTATGPTSPPPATSGPSEAEPLPD